MTRVNIILAILVWASAFALVSSQYRVRHLTIEINRGVEIGVLRPQKPADGDRPTV